MPFAAIHLIGRRASHATDASHSNDNVMAAVPNQIVINCDIEKLLCLFYLLCH